MTATHDTTTPAEGPTSLASLLRLLRQQALLTQEELAERSGMSVGTIAGVESGRTRHPRNGSVRLLADALALTTEQRAALAAAARDESTVGAPVNRALASYRPGAGQTRMGPAQLPAGLRLCVLGPLQARAGSGSLALGPPKQRAVLAMLALNAERVVDLSELVDELWPECPPASAIENVRTYAGNLRRLFNSAEGPRNRIRRQGFGYQLFAEPDDLDLLAMVQEIQRGRAAVAHGDLASAVNLFGAARERWRGSLLAGLRRGPRLAARCTAIEHERTLLMEEEAELRLCRGEPAAAIVLLRAHLAANPLRERTYALLMQALYGIGDVAGALDVYMTARNALVTELGIEPGPELRRIHRGVLNHDLALAVPDRRSRGQGGRQPSPPRELPPDVGCFVGRHDEMQQLLEALAPPQLPVRPRPTVVIVYGPGGVGKSALAVHVAHQVADRFPNGQLYLELDGASSGQRPLCATGALVHMLRGLGVALVDTPADAPDIIARFRTLTADRRLLVVLDNASDAAQVLPLLPATGGCGVIITSRQPLIAVEADKRVRLGALSEVEGRALLRALTREVGGGGAVTDEIVKFCEGLPLAIRIAASRLIGPPDVPAADLADQLADDRQRLDALSRWISICLAAMLYHQLQADAARLGELRPDMAERHGHAGMNGSRPALRRGR